MSEDPRIERMAQVIHDAHVHIHPDAPQAIKDARGKPTRADIEAAMRIYESPEIRRDLAETDLPDGSDWLAARDARVKAEALELAADMCDQRARELSDAATSIDDDYSQFLYEIAVDIREQKAVCADEERNHE